MLADSVMFPMPHMVPLPPAKPECGLNFTATVAQIEGLTVKGHDTHTPLIGIDCMTSANRNSHSVFRDISVEGYYKEYGLRYGWDGTDGGGADHSVFEHIKVLVKGGNTLKAATLIQGCFSGSVRDSYFAAQGAHIEQDAFALELRRTCNLEVVGGYFGGDTTNRVLISGDEHVYQLSFRRCNFEHMASSRQLLQHILVNLDEGCMLHNFSLEHILFSSRKQTAQFTPFRVISGDVHRSKFENLHSVVPTSPAGILTFKNVDRSYFGALFNKAAGGDVNYIHAENFTQPWGVKTPISAANLQSYVQASGTDDSDNLLELA